MAIITFTSDFGFRDHYVAAVKAKIFQFNPSVKVVDISHHIEHFNIAHGAFVLGAVFRDFPKGTVHLVAINTQGKNKDRLVAVKMEEHFFVGADNGIFSLISDKMPVVVELIYDKTNITSFPERNILANTAVTLASGASLYDQGKHLNEGLNKKINRQLRTSKNKIEGHVLHKDIYGNLITNIDLQSFNAIRENRAFYVNFGRESVDKIYDTYSRVDEGDCFAIFNSMNLLEIGIVNGNGAELLGLEYDSPISIEFHPEL